MTRVVYLNAPRIAVINMCAAHNTPIAMIESSQSGRTRVVLHNAHDAALIVSAYPDLVIPECRL